VRDTERQRTAQGELDEHNRIAQGVGQAIDQLEESIADVEAELRRIEAQTGLVQLNAEEMNRKTAELSAELDKARRARETAQEAHTRAMLLSKILNIWLLL